MRDVMLESADREAAERGRWTAYEIAVEQEVERIRGEDDELLEAVEDYDEFTDIQAPFRAWVLAVARNNDQGRREAETELEFIIRDALRRQAQVNVKREASDE